MRITRAALASVLLVGSLAACDVGSDDGGGDTVPMDSTPDDRLCSATFSLSGTYTLGDPAPDLVNNETNEPPGDGVTDEYGCWPVGTWQFTILETIESNCSTPPTPESVYRFTTTYDPEGADGQGIQFDYALEAPALTTNYRLKVSSGGGGLCEGVMELYLDDGKKAWYLHPTLNVYNMSGTLAGSADYNEYAEPIYP